MMKDVIAKIAEELLETAPDALVIINEGGEIVLVNAQAERLFGYTRGQLIGQPLEVLLPERFRDRHRQHRQHYIQEPRFRSMGSMRELYGRCRDGSEFPVEISLSWHRTDKGLLVSSAIRDVTERKRAEQRIQHLAHHDPLTDLPNRTLLADRLEWALANAHRHGKCVAVLFIDLDRFKIINDTLGHAVGDRLLQGVAKRLSGQIRASDTLARLGGDEFIIILEDLDRGELASGVANKLLEALQQPFQIDGHELFIGGSFGISLFPQDGEDAETLLKNADTAMYRSKERGRNTIQFYNAQMNAQSLERLSLESDLHHALERQELELYYQPQVRLADGQIVGVEALVHWHHPQQGQLPPTAYQALAEEAGLILPIDEWALQQACVQLRLWQETVQPELRVAVHLSPRHFLQPDLVERIARILREADLQARWLKLEIPEGLLMQGRQALANLHALGNMGVRLIIDQFGMGYSSLTSLRRFPIDQLKIDPSFVHDLTDDSEDALIVQAVIALAHRLELTVVAEGVENAEQLAFLKAQGCDRGQGNYFSLPLPPKKIIFPLRGRRLPLIDIN